MSTEQVPGGGVQSVREILDLTLARASEADRDDLVLRLTAVRRLLLCNTLQVLVTGAQRQGKSALIEALMLTPMSGPSLDAMNYRESRSTSNDGAAGPGSAGDVEPAHVVLFAAEAVRPLSAVEVEQLRGIQDRCPNLVLVLTMLDRNDGWREVLAQNRTLLSDAGIYVEVSAVSAVWRMRAQWSGDEGQANESGIPAVRADLEGMVADVERPAVQAAVHQTLAAVAELERMLVARRANLADAEGPERACVEVAVIERRAEALRTSAARCPALISGGCATVRGDIALDLRQRLQGVQNELDRALQRSNPGTDWAALTGWLFELVGFEAQLNREFALARGAHVSANLAREFAIAQPHTVSGARVAALPQLPQPPDAATGLPSTSPVNLTVVLGFVMKMWVGFAMFFTVVAVAKLHVAPVLSLVPMLLMAAIGALDERRRWLDRRRTHASAALRRYLGDVTARVNKDLAELVRAIESELHEAYGGRFGRQREVLAADHARAQRDLRGLERSPRVIGEIEDRLRDYAELRRRASGIMPARLLAR